jgi:hypothetical protein
VVSALMHGSRVVTYSFCYPQFLQPIPAKHPFIKKSPAMLKIHMERIGDYSGDLQVSGGTLLDGEVPIRAYLA